MNSKDWRHDRAASARLGLLSLHDRCAGKPCHNIGPIGRERNIPLIYAPLREEQPRRQNKNENKMPQTMGAPVIRSV